MWRSLLFVPPLNDRLVGGAADRGADVVVLDLEAAVAHDRKEEARAILGKQVPKLRAEGAFVAVRINLLECGGFADIASALAADSELIVVPNASPKVIERAASETGPDTPLIPLIESPLGVIEAFATAKAAPSVAALGFGVEDYAAQMGAPPTPALLTNAAFLVIQAARAAGCAPLAFADTIADYKNLARFEATVESSKAMGSAGGFAIHPAQVDILNRIHSPTVAECQGARAIIDAAEEARREGRSIATMDGKMIDEPVEARARAILSQARHSAR